MFKNAKQTLSCFNTIYIATLTQSHVGQSSMYLYSILYTYHIITVMCIGIRQQGPNAKGGGHFSVQGGGIKIGSLEGGLKFELGGGSGGG